MHRHAFLSAACALLALAATSAQAAVPCQAQALEDARKLLAFHRDNDPRVEVQANSVQQLPDLANPVDKRQHYRVVQVMGSIYKANYRMRLIYHHTAGICLLMGQEVLELSQP